MTKKVAVDRIEAAAFTIPTDGPEADGTLSWDSTTIVIAHAYAGGERGLGYTYSHSAAAKLIETKLAEAVRGCDAMAVAGASAAMVKEVRNLGRPGLASAAISAVDTALWDLKARLLGYGSGGFTPYSIDRLQRQLGDWVAAGISRVKMKIGSAPSEDPDRVRAARAAIGAQAELFVDADGAYDRKEALAQAEKFALFRRHGISNTSTIMRGSSRCSSTARRRRSMACCGPMRRRRDWALSSERMRRGATPLSQKPRRAT